MSRFLDDALDDGDDRYDQVRDDGWSNADIRARRFLTAGRRYAGPKDDQDVSDDDDAA